MSSLFLEMLDGLLNRVEALTPATIDPIFDIDQTIQNLTERVQAFNTTTFESTIDRDTPLTQEPELPGMLPQMGSPISSNIAQYVYYPLDESIIITFSNLKDYQYWDVSLSEFQSIVQGNAVAVTKGTNQFGSWWVGKSPSVGAAVYRYLVQSGKPWRRLV